MNNTKMNSRRKIDALNNKKMKSDSSENNSQMLRVSRKKKILEELNRFSPISLMDLLRFLCNTTIYQILQGGLNQVCCSQLRVRNPIE